MLENALGCKSVYDRWTKKCWTYPQNVIHGQIVFQRPDTRVQIHTQVTLQQKQRDIEMIFKNALGYKWVSDDRLKKLDIPSKHQIWPNILLKAKYRSSNPHSSHPLAKTERHWNDVQKCLGLQMSIWWQTKKSWTYPQNVIHGPIFFRRPHTRAQIHAQVTHRRDIDSERSVDIWLGKNWNELLSKPHEVQTPLLIILKHRLQTNFKLDGNL